MSCPIRSTPPRDLRYFYQVCNPPAIFRSQAEHLQEKALFSQCQSAQHRTFRYEHKFDNQHFTYVQQDNVDKEQEHFEAIDKQTEVEVIEHFSNQYSRYSPSQLENIFVITIPKDKCPENLLRIGTLEQDLVVVSMLQIPAQPKKLYSIPLGLDPNCNVFSSEIPSILENFHIPLLTTAKKVEDYFFNRIEISNKDQRSIWFKPEWPCEISKDGEPVYVHPPLDL